MLENKIKNFFNACGVTNFEIHRSTLFRFYIKSEKYIYSSLRKQAEELLGVGFEVLYTYSDYDLNFKEKYYER